MKNGKHTYANSEEWWYQNYVWHRDGGPAITYAGGTKQWYRHGKRHRTDGPAIIWSNNTEAWYINDEELTESEVLIQKEGIEFDNMMREMLSI